jgi:branched-subunit amino acid transport protein
LRIAVILSRSQILRIAMLATRSMMAAMIAGMAAFVLLRALL